MLEVKNLHCSYGTTQVLKGVDIRVNNGEVISILGSSGSGKTTLLRCISFLQKADSAPSGLMTLKRILQSFAIMRSVPCG